MSGRASSPTRQAGPKPDVHDSSGVKNWLQDKDVTTIHKFYMDFIVPEYETLQTMEENAEVQGWYKRAKVDYMALWNEFIPGWLTTKIPTKEEIKNLREAVYQMSRRAEMYWRIHNAPLIKLAQVNRDDHDDYKQRCETCFHEIAELRNHVFNLEQQLNPTKPPKGYSIFSPSTFDYEKYKKYGGKSKRSKRVKRSKRSKQVNRSKRSSTKRH